MNTAIGGISKAGTVFSKLRDDIAAEEQRAAEAAYKQQVFDENVRQFEAQQAYNEEQKRLDRLHDFELERKRHINNKEITQLKIQADNAEKNRAKNRHNQAVAIGRKAYAEAIANGASPLDALWASEQAVAAEGLADTNINYATTVVPTKDRTIVAGMATPEYRATQAAKNNIVAGDLALSAKGKETEYNEYTDIFSRLRSGDDGSQGIIDANTGELRPLTVEEQDYLNKVQNLQVADAMQAAPETIKALRQEATKRGLTIENAEQYGRRNLTGIGSEDIYREQALLYGADPSKVIPTDTANAANEERKNLAILEEVKRQAEADARTNSKTSSYNQSFSEFLDNFKIAGKDGKATIHGIDSETVAEVQTVQEQFMKFGIGNDQFKMYLKLKANDIRYNEAHMMSSSDQAEQFAQNLINDVPKTGTDGTGNNGTGSAGNGANKTTETGGGKKSPNTTATDALSKTGVTTELDKDILDGLGDVLEHRKKRLSKYTNASGGMNSYTRIQFGNPEKAYADMQAEVSNMERILKALANNEQITWDDEAVQVALKSLQKERKDAINKVGLYGTAEYRNRLQRINSMLELFKKGE
jgi:hypothetical protein